MKGLFLERRKKENTLIKKRYNFEYTYNKYYKNKGYFLKKIRIEQMFEKHLILFLICVIIRMY